MSGKKLTQHELRQAMLNHKKKAGPVKKIESPLAKYTESGQLMCILCKSVIRNETVWTVHLNSKSHKENVLLAKKSLDEKEALKSISTTETNFKRPCSPTRERESKKVRGILKNSGQTSALPADFFDTPNGHVEATVPSVTKKTEKLVIQSGVCSKNFENPRVFEGEVKTAKEAASPNTAVLPEGFFDDPILDAKVRNVEYKDPIEEEWDKFQKEIREETAQSAQIIAEDQEEATTERQLDEIEEQIRNWSRVMDLVRRKEQFQAAERKKELIDENVSSGDEEEYDEFLDWRAKTSYK